MPSLIWTDLAGALSCFPPCLLAFVLAASFGKGKVNSELAPVSREKANIWRHLKFNRQLETNLLIDIKLPPWDDDKILLDDVQVSISYYLTDLV